jgi:hypothetical protein
MIWFLTLSPASYADTKLHLHTGGEMLPGARSLVVKTFLTPNAVIIVIKELELWHSTGFICTR